MFFLGFRQGPEEPGSGHTMTEGHWEPLQKADTAQSFVLSLWPPGARARQGASVSFQGTWRLAICDHCQP